MAVGQYNATFTGLLLSSYPGYHNKQFLTRLGEGRGGRRVSAVKATQRSPVAPPTNHEDAVHALPSIADEVNSSDDEPRHNIREVSSNFSKGQRWHVLGRRLRWRSLYIGSSIKSRHHVRPTKEVSHPSVKLERT